MLRFRWLLSRCARAAPPLRPAPAQDKLNGVVEGFYGRPWGDEVRRRVSCCGGLLEPVLPPRRPPVALVREPGLGGALAAILFLGGYYWGIGPIDAIIANGGVAGNALGFVSIAGKGIFLVLVQMWIRWTLPRVRLDQVMHLCMKVLIPFGLACMVGAAVCQLLLGDHTLLLYCEEFFDYSRPTLGGR